MPNKIIESKIVIKSEDQFSRDFTKFFSLLDRGAQKVERFARATLGFGAGAGEGGYGGAVGQPYKNISRGAQRSEFAPPPGGAQMTAGYQRVLRELGVPGAGGPPPPQRPLPPGIVRVSPGGWQPPGTGGGDGGGGGGGGRGGGWGWGHGLGGRMGMLGAGIGVATGLMGAAGGALTPAVGGMMMAAGGAITPTLWGAGAALGLPMMAAGGLMQMTYGLAQPALAHYGAMGDMYRRMGEGRAFGARTTGAKYGFSPDEAIKYAGDLTKVGGYHGFDVMARMRGGGFGAEEMAGFMTSATRAGAAGDRGKAEYERLGKILGAAFAKEGKLPSIAQAIDVMAGLMDTSNQYLGDISDDQTKELAAWTRAWGEGPTAMMKGPRGLKTTAGLWGAIAGPQEPAADMLLYQILSKTRPGMSQYEFQMMKESGLPALRPVIADLAKLPLSEGAPLLSILSKGNLDYTQATTMLKAFKTVGPDIDKQKELLSDAKLKAQGIDLKGRSPTADMVQQSKAEIELNRLMLSEQKNIQDAYKTFETEFQKLAKDMIADGTLVDSAIKKLAEGLVWLREEIEGKKGEKKETPTADSRTPLRFVEGIPVYEEPEGVDGLVTAVQRFAKWWKESKYDAKQERRDAIRSQH